jgi:hypothetical protein
MTFRKLRLKDPIKSDPKREIPKRRPIPPKTKAMG